ncbi:MAG TPA: LysR family transcriptional regulator [Paracoccus sp. (in: a-proteobacteria)]|uniref:LysR family transcriptional regulator n=1 Tax=Paracoccus sp. TaxID=267 RepID=UPI002B7EFD33|nr:LysR family transcriptional regulator [Paracoccus sp. (in: a-proteobacteria)]HWL57630.1 LysR family transcriptional regulator [Paracoccus sp. (in: a-proteobacteria)]
MDDQNWDDIRAAMTVARAGTVSGAADLLGVHHATVIRRIDALEARLGARLFQRHPRGYALTEAGRLLLDAATAAEARFAQMASRIAGTRDLIEGEITVTSLPGLSDLVMPRLTAMLALHSGLRLNYVTDLRLYRLDAGEAHVAIRAGARPTEPDYVVTPMCQLEGRLYAAQAYLDRHGPVRDLSGHAFIVPGYESARAPHSRWMAEHLPEAAIVMASNDGDARAAAIRAGLGLGWLLTGQAAGLVEVMTLPEWRSQLWLVSHVDLHRTPKVQAVLKALKDSG